MHPILDKLKERKLVQWGLAYVAGAWLALQLADTLGPRWGMTDAGARILDLVLVAGFLCTLVVAWYHGERGHQRVTGVELVVLGLLLALCGAAVARGHRPVAS